MHGPVENTHYTLLCRLHRLGDTDADVTEGLPFTWSRERRDWSQPGAVTLTQLDSNVARDGTIRHEIQPDGSGSRITCERHREFFGLRGRIAGSLMVMAGQWILKRQLRAGILRSTR